MQIYQRQHKETLLYYMAFTKSADELARIALSSGLDVSSLSSIKNEALRAEKIAIRFLVALQFGPDAELCHTETGAPYIKDQDCKISISHTKGLVVIAQNPYKSIGVDVEKISARTLRIRSKFLSDEELSFIPNDDARLNTIAWTAKEAMFKAVPEQEIDFTKHLNIIKTKDNKFEGYETRSELRREYQIEIFEENNYITTLAIEKQ